MDNVLSTVKSCGGISIEDNSFDVEIVLYINSVLNTLSQMGLTESDNTIIDPTSTWNDVFKGRTDLEFVKTYISLKVRMVFDPPSNSAMMKCLNDVISELEWRITNNNTIKKVSVEEVIQYER